MNSNSPKKSLFALSQNLFFLLFIAMKIMISKDVTLAFVYINMGFLCVSKYIFGSFTRAL